MLAFTFLYEWKTLIDTHSGNTGRVVFIIVSQENFNMKSKLAFLTLTLVLICTGPLYAAEPRSEANPLQILRAALDLTQEQVTDIRGLLEIRADAIGTISEQIQLLQKQLEEILKDDTADALEVGEIVLETRDLRKEIGQAQESFQSDFRALLTPEQVGRLGNINRVALATKAAEALRQLRLR